MPQTKANPATTTQRTGTTYISFLLDRTGSMSVVRDATIDGFNEFVSSQRAIPGKTRWTLNLFDAAAPDPVLQPVFENVKGREVPKLTRDTFVPRGMTPLYDAVALAIKQARAVPESFENHIFVVMTDGQENASTEYSVEKVRELIKGIEESGWQVIFLGANMDAWETATFMGSQHGTYVTYANTAGSVGAAIGQAAQTSTLYRASGQSMSGAWNVADPNATYRVDQDDDEEEVAKS